MIPFTARKIFEQAKQKEGEDFEDYYVSVQQITEDADLCNLHCDDCRKTVGT